MIVMYLYMYLPIIGPAAIAGLFGLWRNSWSSAFVMFILLFGISAVYGLANGTGILNDLLATTRFGEAMLQLIESMTNAREGDQG